MSEVHPFFRFPIGLLAYDAVDPKQTLSHIIDWCVGNVADGTFGTWSHDALKAEISRRDAGADTIYYRRKVGECRLLLAADTLGVHYGIVTGLQTSIFEARRFLGSVSPAACNNTAQVKTDWVWDCLKTIRGETPARTLSFREFRVLCALLSKVGAKGVKKCSWREVQARAAGFCGKADLARCCDDGRERITPLMLTRAEIRTTLRRLEINNFFARYNHGWNGKARESWFSFSMPREDLRNLVLSRKVQARVRYSELRRQDREAAESKQSNRSLPRANINTN